METSVSPASSRLLASKAWAGSEKTVLATALAHDQEVRKAFPDGIYWLTAGQKPNLLVLQNQLLCQLTGSEQALVTEQEAKDALRKAFEGRRLMVILDDVWTFDDADALSKIPPLLVSS